MLRRSIPNPPEGCLPTSLGRGLSEFGAVSIRHLSHTHAGKNITNLANGLVDHFIEGLKSILWARQFFWNILTGICVSIDPALADGSMLTES